MKTLPYLHPIFRLFAGGKQSSLSKHVRNTFFDQIFFSAANLKDQIRTKIKATSITTLVNHDNAISCIAVAKSGVLLIFKVLTFGSN